MAKKKAKKTKKVAPKSKAKKPTKKPGVISRIKNKIKSGRAKKAAARKAKKTAVVPAPKRKTPRITKLLVNELAPFVNAKLNAGQPIDEHVNVTDAIKEFCIAKKLR